MLAQSLLDGTIKSCGCLRADNCRENGYRTARANAERKHNINIPAESSKKGAKQQYRGVRIAMAFDSVFRSKPDTIHVDRPGARVVRGGRY